MSTVTHPATLHASKAATWDVLDDFEGVHRWHFNVESSTLASPNNEGPGATRKVRMYDGTEVTEQIVEYDEGTSMKVAFVEHAMPLKRADVVFRLREVAEDRTEVTIHMDYDMKYGPVGWLLDRAFLKPTMRKVFGRMVEGLERHVVSGDLIGKDGVPVAVAS
ncbi:MAG: SRPBCC family protein [Myxococcota bacterium]